MNPDDIDRSIIIADTETTGVDKNTDEVIELAVQYGFRVWDPVQLDADVDAHMSGSQTVWRFKPSKPVGDSAKIHGITDEMLEHEHPFSAYAPRVAVIFDEAEVIIGYNLNFDLDMLTAMFDRVGIRPPDLSRKILIDPLALWRVMEPRKLEHAFARFVGGQLKGAHAAGVDVAATGDVLLGMIRDFDLGGRSWADLQAVTTPDAAYRLGYTGQFKWTYVGPNGPLTSPVVIFTFGKHEGFRVDDPDVRGYLKWMTGDTSGFPSPVKEIAAAAMKLKDRFLAWARERYPPPPPPVTPP